MLPLAVGVVAGEEGARAAGSGALWALAAPCGARPPHWSHASNNASLVLLCVQSIPDATPTVSSALRFECSLQL